MKIQILCFEKCQYNEGNVCQNKIMNLDLLNGERECNVVRTKSGVMV